MHAGHAGGGDAHALLWTLVLPGALLGAGLLYGGMVARQRRAGRRWPAARSRWFALGAGLLAAGLSPPLTALAHTDGRAHMLQHLLTGMFAPLALALAWPLTLTLRSLPVRTARRLGDGQLGSGLHALPLVLLASPVTALALNVGGLYLLYLTPLYGLTLHSPPLHALVQLHIVAAGLLYTGLIAGAEPVTARAPFALRLGVLLLGAAAHAILAKLLYAGPWPRGTGDSPAELREAARLMYYGGDLAELLLAALVFRGWYHERGRAWRRAQSRAQVPGNP